MNLGSRAHAELRERISMPVIAPTGPKRLRMSQATTVIAPSGSEPAVSQESSHRQGAFVGMTDDSGRQ